MTTPAGFAFSPDGQLLVVFGGDPDAAGSARVWEVATSQPATPTLHHGATITDANLDATRLVTTGADGSVRVWSLASPLPPSPPDAPVPGISPDAWQQAAELLAARTLDSDGTLHPLGTRESKMRWESLRTRRLPFSPPRRRNRLAPGTSSRPSEPKLTANGRPRFSTSTGSRAPIRRMPLCRPAYPAPAPARR